jgi:REP element-mobilizing transposase RayT
MSNSLDVFEEDKIYHIYSRAVGNDLLFIEKKNYQFFLDKYDQFCSKVFTTLGYCLMPNHFHFLVQVKPEIENHQVVKVFSDFLTPTQRHSIRLTQGMELYFSENSKGN